MGIYNNISSSSLAEAIAFYTFYIRLNKIIHRLAIKCIFFASEKAMI